MEERTKLRLTGLLMLNLVLMFLPWFGKGELMILGIEALLGPLMVAGVLVFMLGLWWRPYRQRMTCLLGTLAILSREVYAFFFWANQSMSSFDPAFSLRFARPGFYLGFASSLVLLAACLLCRAGEEQAAAEQQRHADI